MAGFRGQVTEPRADPRGRRNSQNLASSVSFIDQSGVISLDGDGLLQLSLGINSGLANVSSALVIDLDATPGLVLTAGGIAALVQGVLSIDASGIQLDLATDPALEDSTGLRVKIKASGGITRDANGLSVAAATPTVLGAVLEAAASADSGEDTVTITLPADLPATADALRDDLVANALPEIQASIRALATEHNDLLAKLRTSGALNV